MGKTGKQGKPEALARSNSGGGGSVLAALAVLGALLAAFFFLIFQPASESLPQPSLRQHRGPSSPSPVPESPPKPLATLGSPRAMATFSSEHNASLLWGTFRPGVYFGLRSRSYPTALAAGLMWVHGSAPTMAKLRHKCEQDQVDRYGFMAHDGRSFGAQPIVDSANAIALQTSYVRAEDGGWAVRIEGEERLRGGGGGGGRGGGGGGGGRGGEGSGGGDGDGGGGVGGGGGGGPYPAGGLQSLFFYLAVDAEHDAERVYDTETGARSPSGGFEKASKPAAAGASEATARVVGRVRDLGVHAQHAFRRQAMVERALRVRRAMARRGEVWRARARSRGGCVSRQSK